MQPEVGWDVVNCYDEWSGGVSNLGRDGKREGGNIEHRTPNIEHRSEEKRKKRTNPALRRLNPNLPVEAVEEQSWDRTALSGDVKVIFPDQEHGGLRVEVVSLVDWGCRRIMISCWVRSSEWRGETILGGRIW